MAYTPPTTGIHDAKWYGDLQQRGRLSQKVTLANGGASARLDVLIPPRCRLIWGNIKNMATTTFATGSSATGTPTVMALVLSTASAMSTSVLASSTGTSVQGAVMTGPATTNSNVVAANDFVLGRVTVTGGGTNDVRASAVNTTTSHLYAYLVPMNIASATNEHRFFVAAGGYTFAAASAVDVVLEYERFYDTADAA